MREQGTGGPSLMTSLAPRLGWLPLGFGLILALITALGIVALIVGRGEPGHAQVTSTTPGSAEIVVLDGPEPKAWTVTFLDESNVDPNEVVEVRLGGDCGCEPRSDPGSPLVLVLGGVFFGVLLVVSVRMARSTKAIRSAQLRSLAVADLGTPATEVVVRPRFSPGSIRNARLWLEVIDGGSGRSLGWLDIRRARPAFDAPALVSLVGAPILGADVALTTASGSARALAAGPLVGESGPAAAWSSLVVEALGWNRPSVPTGVPTVGGDGRLSVGSVPSEAPSALRELVQARRAGGALASARVRLLGIYAAWLIAFFLLPFPGNLVAMVGVLALFILLATRQQAPVRAAVRAAAPALSRREVNVASALLVALGGQPTPSPVDPDPSPPPAARTWSP
ncbi:MAG: hypothetical protein JWO77_3516 [Ilumatobacteraceae bacterium]|nr:hypothetical protein [Ilumatobacteraceae bacterium]